MKKTIIGTLVVLILSIISVVCFGVALGAQVTKGVIDPQSEIRKWIEKYSISDIIGNASDTVYNVNDHFWSENTGTLIATDKLELDPQNSEYSTIPHYNIDAEFAKINIIPGSSEKIVFTLQQYKLSSASSQPAYSLSKQDNTITVGVNDTTQTKHVVAVLTVEVPKKALVGDFEIDLECGYITLDQIDFVNSLDISLSAGNIDLKSGQSEKCTLKVGAGNINIGTFLAKSTDLDIGVGYAEICLPSNKSIIAEYKVAGNVSARKLKTVKGFSNNTGFTETKVVHNVANAETVNYTIDIVGNINFVENESL